MGRAQWVALRCLRALVTRVWDAARPMHCVKQLTVLYTMDSQFTAKSGAAEWHCGLILPYIQQAAQSKVGTATV